MGQRFAVPQEDENMTRLRSLFLLKKSEVAQIWNSFLILDKTKVGKIKLSELFIYFEEERNLFTDAILEVLEIEHEGDINFSDYLNLISSYCMMEEMDIIKMCFCIFDSDKNGYCTAEDMKMLMNILQNVKHPDTVTGTVKKSWMGMRFSTDGRVEFEEFVEFHKANPRLFQPAFRLQTTMQRKVMGESFWDDRKRMLYETRALADAKIQKKKQDKIDKKKNYNDRKIRKKMGLIRYYLCPCYRSLYDPKFEGMTDEEREEQRSRVAIAKRLADLKVKNPETVIWKKFEKKITPEQGGDENYIKKKVEKTDRKRESRAESRADRKAARSKNTDLQHKFTTTISHVDV